MGVGRNAEAPRRLVPRLALVLTALVLAPAAQGKTPPPDATFAKTINGVHYRCFEWGRPPKQFVIVCIPKKKAATKGAA